jgi:polar amino acid transport system substrate-binding protein
MRADGTWERLYDARLRSLGPSPGPPPARYAD